jgi:prepilin-type N-terminal cleavage/methylation domain-containing protein/prepilin-type processing-associated H-X9-DG protein
MFIRRHSKPSERQPTAFTLVELLVVITIIGILIALLLPAVQAAREAARVAQCLNHVKQLSLGCLDHESATGRFPTGGWGWAWTGDPDRGNDWRQPAGWIYNVLPYIEQQALHDLGAGLPEGSPAKMVAGTQRVQTPLVLINCPSRRPAILYPWTEQSWFTFSPGNMDRPLSGVARSDYAICGGDYYTSPNWPRAIQAPYAGPASYADVDTIDPQYGMTDAQYVATTTASGYLGPPPSAADGVCFCLSMIRPKDVTDGLSCTYLLGEKYLCPDLYDTGESSGDNEWALQGYDWDIERFGNPYPMVEGNSGYDQSYELVPFQDTPGFEVPLSFGSAHANGFNMSFCDGSVRTINYTIDLTTHMHLCNRHDGQAVDAKKY